MSSKLPLILSISLIAAGLIVIRYQFSQTKITPGKVNLQESLNNEPTIKGQRAYFNFQGYEVINSVYPQLHYGQIVRIDGEANDKGVIYFPKVETVGESNNIQERLFSLRSVVEEKINKFLPEPQASLMDGLLLGVNKDLPADFQTALRKTGTIHVVVVSGYNISVVGGFFLLLAGVIKRRYTLVLALGAIVFYTLMTGASAPTVRAAIMGVLAFLAMLTGRQNWPFYSLLLAAFIMLLVSPRVISEIGFQLSFLATAGIILFEDKISPFFKNAPSPFGEDLITTLSAQVLVIPIIFYNFGQVSIISPIVNALVLWTVPLATLLGFGIAFFGLLFEPLGQLLAWIAWVPLSIFVWLVEALAKAPLATIKVPEKNIWVLVSYYLGLSVVIFILLKYVRIYKKKSE